MAQERLQIRLDAVDNTKKAFNSLQGNTQSAKNALFNLKNVLIGLGGGLALRSIINVGKQIEGLGVRFKFLFGSLQEGNKAFTELTNFAAKVPFSLEEISAASGNLAVVSKDAKQLAKILEITGNVAAVTGLDFQTTASQIQRAFSGGLAAADVFREKGVRKLLEFSDGASASADETAKRFEEVFGKGGRFGEATSELAKTFEGTLSMLGDKLFKFKSTIVKAGFFDTLKKEFGDLNKFAEKHAEALDEIAVTIGTVLAEAIVGLSEALKVLVKYSSELVEVFKVIIAYKLAAMFLRWGYALIPVVTGLTTIAALSGVGLALVAAAAAAGTAAYFLLGQQIDAIKKKAEEANHAFKNIDFEHELSIKVDNFEEVFILIDEFEHELSVRIPSAIEKISASFNDLIIKDLENMQLQLSNIEVIIAQGLYDGIKAMSSAIAESIILGKSLGDAFRNFVQRAIIGALAALIQYLATKLLIWALEQLFPNLLKNQIDLEQQKLQIMKKQTAELTKQMAIKAILMFMGGFAEGGRVNGSRAEGGKVNGYRATGGQTSNGNAYIVGERGRELFIPSTDGQIVPNEKMGGMGATNVTFNVSATDVKGVQALLIDNRATITNIINSALNQKGKPALI